MSLFEKFLSPKKEDVNGEPLAEMPGVQPGRGDVPEPEIKRDQWDKNHPEDVQEIIDRVKKEEEIEKKREHIIDEIIQDRDSGKHQH